MASLEILRMTARSTWNSFLMAEDMMFYTESREMKGDMRPERRRRTAETQLTPMYTPMYCLALAWACWVFEYVPIHQSVNTRIPVEAVMRRTELEGWYV